VGSGLMLKKIFFFLQKKSGTAGDIATSLWVQVLCLNNMKLIVTTCDYKLCILHVRRLLYSLKRFDGIEGEKT